MEERVKSLQTVYETFEEEEPTVEEDSSSLLCERKEEIFCVQDSLQFFNSKDVTPLRCGYKFTNRLSQYEAKMLSFKPDDLQNVLSGFLLTANSNCISDCKSFITYLLRSMSVQEDPASIFACFNALNSLLAEHPDAKLINFNSAEIFMLLFNYGIDMKTFTFLQQYPDVQQNFTFPESNTKSNSRIPSMWRLNLEMILKSFSKLASTCHILDKDLAQIITFLLWMNLSNVLGLSPLIGENISICLKHITKEKWEEALCDIANVVICMDFPNKKGKWHNILLITNRIPVYSKRGIQLQRLISSWVLKIMISKNPLPEVDKNYVEFELSVVQNLLKEIFNFTPETLVFALKFLDVYITHLNVPKEVYQDIYKLIQRSEVNLHHASEAKSFLCIMMTKLQIFI